MIVYTDGSCITGYDGCRYGGVGIWYSANDPKNRSIPLVSDKPTNQAAELLAIDYAIKDNKEEQHITIKSDSSYSIKCVTEWYLKWQDNGWKNSKGEVISNIEIVKCIVSSISERKSQGKTTDFVHVYGHKGEEGNEGADKLASSGSKSSERLSLLDTAYFYNYHLPFECFSQFYMCKIVMEEGGKTIEYNCAEQYHHYQKALLFGDHNSAQKIMASKYPNLQKSIGRRVRGFNQDIWLSKCYEICRRCNVQKFKQNPDILSVLLSTKGRKIAEASPTDKVWGIGLCAAESMCGRKWTGMNLLGKVLMDIRDNEFS